MGLFSSRSSSVTTCTEGIAVDNLPTTVVTCEGDDVCQVLVRYHTHPASGNTRSHYHCEYYLQSTTVLNRFLARCVKKDVCQSNIKSNAAKCTLFSHGRSLMAQCGGCCTGNLCDLYGPTFNPGASNVADGSTSQFGTLTHASSGKK